jgi:hypothetical protein
MALMCAHANAGETYRLQLPETDLVGGEYTIKRGVSLDTCRQSCIRERKREAFTYDTRHSWCFLKTEWWEEREEQSARYYYTMFSAPC